jgi:hypothetical protein
MSAVTPAGRIVCVRSWLMAGADSWTPSPHFMRKAERRSLQAPNQSASRPDLFLIIIFLSTSKMNQGINKASMYVRVDVRVCARACVRQRLGGTHQSSSSMSRRCRPCTPRILPRANPESRAAAVSAIHVAAATSSGSSSNIHALCPHCRSPGS